MPADKINYKINDTFTSLLDLIYPIGSLYMTINNTSPSQLFGGQWVEINDVFLAACGKDLSYFNKSVGTFQGGNTIQITQLPSHTHPGFSHTHTAPDHLHHYITSAFTYSEMNANDWTATSSLLNPKKDSVVGAKMFVRNTGATISASGVVEGGGTTSSAGGDKYTGSTGGGKHSYLIPMYATYGEEQPNPFLWGDAVWH